MAKTVALNIKLNLEGGKTLDLAVTNFEEMKAAIKQVQGELNKTKFGDAGFDKLNSTLKTLKTTFKDLGKEGSAALDGLGKNTAPLGYYRQLQAELTKLKNSYKDLSQADVNSNIGKNIAAQANRVSAELKRLDSGLGDFQRNVGNYGSAFDGLGATFGRIAGVFGVAIGALTGGNAIVNATKEFQTLFATLSNAVGGDNAASKIFEQLKAFATETPEQLNDVVASFIRLNNTGFAPTIDQLTNLTDLARSQGKGLAQFSEAIIDAQTGEFERLKEFGIRVKKDGDNLQATFKGQTTQVKFTSQAIQEYLVGLGKLPGVAGSAAAVSKTLEGSISNLLDNVTNLAAGIGNSGLGKALQFIIGEFSEFIQLIGTGLQTPLSEEIQKQQFEFNALFGVLQDVNSSENTRNKAIEELNRKYPDLIGNIDLQRASESELQGILIKSNKEFEKKIFLQAQNEQINKFAKSQAQALENEFQAQKRINELNAENNALGSGSGGKFGAVTGAVSKALNDLDIDLYTEKLQKAKDEQAALQKTQEDYSNFVSTRGIEIFGSEADAAAAYTKSLSDGTTAVKKDKDEKKLLAGTVEFLEDKLKKLNDQLNNSTADKFPDLIEKVKVAEKELAGLKETIEKLKNPLDLTVTPTIEFGGDNQQIEENFKKAGEVAAAGFEEEFLKRLKKSQVEQQEALTKGIQKSEEERKKNQEKEAEEAAKKRQSQIDFAVDTASQITDAITQIENERVNRQAEAALTALDDEYAKKIEKAQGNKALIEKLEKEQAQKRIAIEKDAARKRQRIAITEIIIQGVLAQIKTFPNPAAAVATVLALIVARSQQFAKGGVVKGMKTGKVTESPNFPTQAGGDNVLALVKPGEMFLNQRQQRRAEKKFGRHIWDEIGVPGFSNRGATVRMPQRFADGGVAQTQILELQISDAQMDRLAAKVAASTGYAVQTGVVEGSRKATRDTNFFNRTNQ